jgi:hypothetical protein
VATSARHARVFSRDNGLSFGFEAGDARYVHVRELDSPAEHSSPVDRTMFTSPSMPTNVVMVVVEGAVNGPIWPGAVIRVQLLGIAAPPPTALCSLKSSLLGPEWSMHNLKRTDKCWATLSPDLGIRKARQLRCVMGGVHQFFAVHGIRYVNCMHR